MNKIEQIANLIKNKKNIMVLTGAGMSTESGIPDFRSQNGLYKHGPENILSFKNFKHNPNQFFDFIKKYMDFSNAQPNIGHKILAKWEINKNIKIITQNIDNLHQDAGSINVIELHGTLKTGTCRNIECEKQYPIEKVLNSYKCECGSLIKPDIILFGETVSQYSNALKNINSYNMLIVLGTSLSVYPAAEIPSYFDGKPIVIINKTPTQYDNYSNVISINGGIGKILEAIDKLL